MADVTTQYANNIETVVTNNPLTAVETAINVLNGSIFPTLGAGEYFYATLYQEENPVTEVVKITAVNSNTLTAVRGQDNTTAREWLATTSLGMRANAAVFEELRDKANEISPDNYLPIAGGTLGDDNLTIANTAPKFFLTDTDRGLDDKTWKISNDSFGRLAVNAMTDAGSELTNKLRFYRDGSDGISIIRFSNTSGTFGNIDYTNGQYWAANAPVDPGDLARKDYVDTKAAASDLANYLKLDGTSTMTGAIDTTSGAFTRDSVASGDTAYNFDTATPIVSGKLLSLNSSGVEKARLTLNDAVKQYGRIELPDTETTPNNFYFGYSTLDTQYAGMFNDFGDFWLGINGDQSTYINYYNGTNVTFGSGTQTQSINCYLSSAGLRLQCPNSEIVTIDGSTTGDIRFTASVTANNFLFSHNIDATSFNGVALTDGGSGNQFLADDGSYGTLTGSGDTLAAADEAITGLWDFQNAGGLVTDVIDESTLNAGVAIEGILFKDNSMSVSGSTSPVINISNDTGGSGQQTAIISTTAPNGVGLQASASSSSAYAARFYNTSGSYNNTVNLGAGGDIIAEFSYFTTVTRIRNTGRIEAPRGINRIATAGTSGYVDVSASAQPVGGEVLRATSPTAATWQGALVSQVKALASWTYSGTTKFDTVDFDDPGWWDAVNFRFVPDIPGYYRVSVGALVEIKTSAAGGSNCYLDKNGSIIASSQNVDVDRVLGDKHTHYINQVVYMNGTTDYLSLDDGVTSSVEPSLNGGTYMTLEYIGP